MPPIITESKKEAMSLYREAYRGNFFRSRITDEEITVDVYVQSLDHLYSDPIITDFGTVKKRIDPEFLFRLANMPSLIKQTRISAVKKKTMHIVFHVAEKYLHDGSADTLAQDFHAEMDDMLPKMKQVKKDQESNNHHYFLIGLCFIILCTALAEIVGNTIDRAGFFLGIIEGICVLAWVVLWRPIDYYAFFMVQGRRMKQVYQKIMQADVTAVVWDGVVDNL